MKTSHGRKPTLTTHGNPFPPSRCPGPSRFCRQKTNIRLHWSNQTCCIELVPGSTRAFFTRHRHRRSSVAVGLLPAAVVPTRPATTPSGQCRGMHPEGRGVRRTTERFMNKRRSQGSTGGQPTRITATVVVGQFQLPPMGSFGLPLTQARPTASTECMLDHEGAQLRGRYALA